MTKADQFREYAREAIQWSQRCQTEDEKQTLVHLASTWATAALRCEPTVIGPAAYQAAALRRSSL
jgi:hypothetical protein